MSGVFASGLDFWARIGGKAASPRQATHGQTIRSTRTHFPFIAPLASNGALPTTSWAPVGWHVVRRIADILPCPERRRCNSRATTASPDGLIRPAHALQANCPLSLPSSCDEVGGQPLVTKGVQPPPPEPDGHVCVHPALQTQELLGVVLQA